MKISYGLILAVVLAVLASALLFAQVPPPPVPDLASEEGEWRMLSSNIQRQLGIGTVEEQGTVFVYNIRTGVVYQHFPICTNLDEGCFIPMPFLSRERRWVLAPSPTSGPGISLSPHVDVDSE
ncbi:MAG: hypothetical protein OXN89_03985 [Bryobacterales bacterium]|nr:hypothetical protein [Bryobacterales bacterium]